MDGIYIAVKGGGGRRNKKRRERNKEVVLVAVGLRVRGKEVIAEVIDFLATGSSKEKVEDVKRFLRSMKERGLRGERLRLIVVDNDNALKKGVKEVYPEVKIQLCWAHEIRRLLDEERLEGKERREFKEELRKLMDTQGDSKEVLQYYEEFKEKYKEKYPRAVKKLSKDIKELVTFHDEPKEVASFIRTTNILERLNREIRGGLRSKGAFSSRESVDRMVYLAIKDRGFQWEVRHGHPKRKKREGNIRTSWLEFRGVVLSGMRIVLANPSLFPWEEGGV